ncbi:MAG: lipopolysaccharide heptosyltransferase II [Blastocatellia bacterium]|nr:lipopolysaccharide heptosyltransferase II [Blastocatellia bacterium]
MKIMIRAPNWVGDAVMAVPALRELRRVFTSDHITLVARPLVAGLFEGEHLADDLIVTTPASGLIQSMSRFISEVRGLRRERFDLAVLFQNAFGAALLAQTAGARNVAGYPTDGRRALLDTVIPFKPDYKTGHQVFYYLNIAAHIEQAFTGECLIETESAASGRFRPRLSVSEERRARARLMLAEFGIDSDGRIAVISPGATNSRAKRWLAERFAETADILAERDGFQTIIVGAAGDREVARETALYMRTPSAMLAGRTSVAELKAVLACSALVVSNDTGTAHVSAALGVPTVVVFGPTEHFSTRPMSDVATVVRHQVDCSPCMLRDCPIDHRCMTRVEVADVYRAAQSLLAGVVK